ncbi:MAG: branched-chain amino acid ABC transporter permease [Bacteroidetes bacterium]|nr:branched-chain amino acid ABC transporter permease [Bacteroidota bacterium]
MGDFGYLAQQVINGLQLGLVYALIALGYTMVYGIIRLINFAHGDVFMVGAFVGFFAISAFHQSFLPAMLAAIVVCVVLAVAIERFAYRPLRSAPRIASLITAIGVSIFLEYFTSLKFVFGPNIRTFPRPFEVVTWQVGGLSITSIQVIVLGVTVFMLALLQFVVYRTKMGMAMRGVSYDFDTAKLMGINVDVVVSFTFALGSALAGAGGVLFAIAYPQVQPFMGIMPGLKAFVAAVLGGIGIIPGAMLGALIMGQAEVLTAAFVSTTWKDAVAFAILIAVLMIKPTGLLGKRGTDKV